MTPPTNPTLPPNVWPFPTWMGTPLPTPAASTEPLRLEPAKRAPKPASGHVSTQPMEAPF